MPVLSIPQVESFRALKARLAYHDRFQVVRRARATDADVTAPAPTVVAEGMCSLRGIGGGTERIIADRLGYENPYAIDVPAWVDLNQITDRLVVNGRTFEVGANSTDGVLGIDRTLICRERG